MGTPTLDLWQDRLARALPWLRWTTVAAASVALLSQATTMPWVVWAVSPMLVIAGVQLAGLTLAVISQPKRDREASDHLDILIARTSAQGVHLVEICDTQLATAAGQQASIIDQADGRQSGIWLPLAYFPSGSLVLVQREHSCSRPLDWLLVDQVQAAFRHRRRERARADRGATTRLRTSETIEEIEKYLAR